MGTRSTTRRSWIGRTLAVLASLLVVASCGDDSPELPDASENNYVPQGGPAPFALVTDCPMSVTRADGSTITATVDEVSDDHPEQSTTRVAFTDTVGDAVWTRSFNNSEARCVAAAGTTAVVRIDANFSEGQFCFGQPQCWEFDRYLQAFDLTTGESPWRVRLGGLPDFLVAVDAESVAVVSDKFLDGPQLQVLDTASGDLRWSTMLSDNFALFVVVDGVGVGQGLVVVQIGDNIGVWDAVTGEPVRTGRPATSTPPGITTPSFSDADRCEMWAEASVRDPIPENRKAVAESYRREGCAALCGGELDEFTGADPPVFPDCSGVPASSPTPEP